MYCSKCGKENNDNGFCVYCGEKIIENEGQKSNNTQLENIYCSNCGKKLALNEQFCSQCGYNIYKKEIFNNNNLNNSSIALAGFICSIIGCFILPVILGIIGIVLGIIGRNQNNISEKSKKHATVAIILGVIDTVWYFAFQGFIIGFLSTL